MLVNIANHCKHGHVLQARPSFFHLVWCHCVAASKVLITGMGIVIRTASSIRPDALGWKFGTSFIRCIMDQLVVKDWQRGDQPGQESVVFLKGATPAVNKTEIASSSNGDGVHSAVGKGPSLTARRVDAVHLARALAPQQD